MGADSSPQQVLSSNTDKWMMVDKSMVSTDGTTCNKVGTSYFAFQYQSVTSFLFLSLAPVLLSSQCFLAVCHLSMHSCMCVHS